VAYYTRREYSTTQGGSVVLSKKTAILRDNKKCHLIEEMNKKRKRGADRKHLLPYCTVLTI